MNHLQQNEMKPDMLTQKSKTASYAHSLVRNEKENGERERYQHWEKHLMFLQNSYVKWGIYDIVYVQTASYIAWAEDTGIIIENPFCIPVGVCTRSECGSTRR